MASSITGPVVGLTSSVSGSGLHVSLDLPNRKSRVAALVSSVAQMLMAVFAAVGVVIMAASLGGIFPWIVASVVFLLMIAIVMVGLVLSGTVLSKLSLKRSQTEESESKEITTAGDSVDDTQVQEVITEGDNSADSMVVSSSGQVVDSQVTGDHGASDDSVSGSADS